MRAVENFLGGESNYDGYSFGVSVFYKERGECVKTIWTGYFIFKEVYPSRHKLSPPFDVRFKMKKP